MISRLVKGTEVKKNKVVCASAVGKTAFCPHAHYLSTKFPPDKESRKRMAKGTKKHDQLTRSETKSKSGGSSWIIWLALIGLAFYWWINS